MDWRWWFPVMNLSWMPTTTCCLCNMDPNNSIIFPLTLSHLFICHLQGTVTALYQKPTVWLPKVKHTCGRNDCWVSMISFPTVTFSVPIGSERHCYSSLVDLFGLWLNHNRPETSWYQGTNVTAGEAGTVIRWASASTPGEWFNKPRQLFISFACTWLLCLWGYFVSCVRKHRQTWTWNTCVCVCEEESRWSDQAVEEETDHIWPSWLPPICALLSSPHPPLSPAISTCSQATHTCTQTQSPDSLSTFISSFISSELQTNLLPDSISTSPFGACLQFFPVATKITLTNYLLVLAFSLSGCDFKPPLSFLSFC